MKDILIVIGDMRIGGAQKSLLSFLQSLQASASREKYRIDLMVIDPQGPFMHQLPDGIRLVTPPTALTWLGTAFGFKLLKNHFSLGCLWQEVSWLVRSRCGLLPGEGNTQQKLWQHWQEKIPVLSKHYDVAVGYIDGCPNYYVMDKVQADKKILWVHSQYSKQGYDPVFDHTYFSRADGLVTISQVCMQDLQKHFPACPVHILENITSAAAVLERSEQGSSPEFCEYAGCKLLTVARLNPQKGVDLAVEAAAILQQQGVPFRWLVAGDGSQREQLQNRIDTLGLGDSFKLLGSCDNPYIYMKNCDILVQPSRVEGRSIVLDEAKILEKPIVATAYPTVTDSLCHGSTGWIVELTPEALAEGIRHLWQSDRLRQELVTGLQQLPKGNDRELEKYLEIML